MNQIPKNTFAVLLTSLILNTRHTFLAVSYSLLFPLIKVAYYHVHGAVKENRTPVPSLEDWCSTIELLPHIKWWIGLESNQLPQVYFSTAFPNATYPYRWLVVYSACTPLA